MRTAAPDLVVTTDFNSIAHARIAIPRAMAPSLRDIVPPWNSYTNGDTLSFNRIVSSRAHPHLAPINQYKANSRLRHSFAWRYRNHFWQLHKYSSVPLRNNGTLVLVQWYQSTIGRKCLPHKFHSPALLDTPFPYSLPWRIAYLAGVAQWKSEGLIIPRPWVRFPPPAPFNPFENTVS